MCRVRPLTGKESELSKLHDGYLTYPDMNTLKLLDLQNQKHMRFEFTRVFDTIENQNIVFEEVEPLILSAIDGHNICIMAYGQTGSGKTFTMVDLCNDHL